MQLVLALLGALALGLSGCAPIVVNAVEQATRPLEPRVQLEETIRRYTSDLRYGRIDAAAARVEPDLRDRFQARARALRGIRFTDCHLEQLLLEPGASSAEAVVVYRGYWLSSPFEREVRVVQRWRRDASWQWLLTPDLETLIEGPETQQRPAAPAEI